MHFQMAAFRSASAEDLRQLLWLPRGRQGREIGGHRLDWTFLFKTKQQKQKQNKKPQNDGWINVSMELWLKTTTTTKKDQCGTNPSSFPLQNSQCFDQCLGLSGLLLLVLPSGKSLLISTSREASTVASSLKKTLKALLPPSRTIKSYVGIFFWTISSVGLKLDGQK